MYLLDTNVVSELRRPGRAEPKVLAWAASAPVTDIFLSVITILELEMGVLSIERRDAAQGQVLRAWFEEQVLPRFAGRILPVDLSVARACSRLHVPDRQTERDAMIAATALVHGLTVVTRNVGDFQASGCRLLNPWTAAATGA